MKHQLLLLCVVANVAVAQCPVPPLNTPSAAAQKLAIAKLSEFLKCEANDPISDQSPCNVFASRGLEAIYGVADFKTTAGQHFSANQIWDAVNAAGVRWARIGPILNEQNNLCAQSVANAGMPIIAVMQAEGHGHVALVVPGEPTPSAIWGMLAANGASFFLDKPASGFVSKPLSHAFSKDSAGRTIFFYRKP